MTKILLSGYFGFNNFGDETILRSTIFLLKKYFPNPEITVLSKNPTATTSFHSINSVSSFDLFSVIRSISSTDVLFSGGGSLLQDVTSLKSLFYYLFIIFTTLMFRKKTVIWAQGIGPINNHFGRFLTKLALKKADIVTIRDENSQKLLKSWAIKSILIDDPVWLLDDEKNLEQTNFDSSNKTIGIQLREWQTLSYEKIQALAESIYNNFNDEYSYKLIPLQNEKDKKACNDLSHKLSDKGLCVEVIENISLEDTIKTLCGLDFLISMRFHASLVAIKNAVPTLLLSYDPKVETLAQESGSPLLKIENLNKDSLDKALLGLKTNESKIKEHLEKYSNEKQQKSRHNIDQAMKLL